MRQWLVTGGCGFIGSALVRVILAERPDVRVVNLDALTYAGHPANVEDAAQRHGDRYCFRRANLVDAAQLAACFREEGPFEAILHLAAESHVDRSIESALAFVETNVTGTQRLLDAARENSVGRFLHVSTDEVYGALPLEPEDAKFSEESPLAPRSPYAASKASAELLALAAFHTHGLSVTVTRGSNTYGPRQFPEKLIPLMILRASADEPLPVYGDGLYVRDWLYVDDHARGMLAALEKGKPGEAYNLGGDNEWPNIALVKDLLRRIGKPESLIRHVEDRKGHDRRYALDSSKAHRELDWAPQMPFELGLDTTLRWYTENTGWVNSIRSKDYLAYIEKHYPASRYKA